MFKKIDPEKEHSRDNLSVHKVESFGLKLYEVF